MISYIYSFNMQMYISLHSFGELILYPWSHTTVPIHDWLELDQMARKWSDTISQSSNRRYKYKVTIYKYDYNLGHTIFNKFANRY